MIFYPELHSAMDVLGENVTRSAYHRTPEESRERIIQHIKQLRQDASNNDIKKLIH